MNRRNFLSFLGISAVIPVIAPELPNIKQTEDKTPELVINSNVPVTISKELSGFIIIRANPNFSDNPGYRIDLVK